MAKLASVPRKADGCCGSEEQTQLKAHRARLGASTKEQRGMKTLEPVSSEYQIPEVIDGHECEFSVQAFLYTDLLEAGFDVRGEVPWRNKKARMSCRFDVVIYEFGRPVWIVEVKARPVSHRTVVEDTRQGRRYRMFGVPVTFVYGPEDAQRFVQFQIERRNGGSTRDGS